MWRGTLNVDLCGLHRGVQPANDLYLLKNEVHNALVVVHIALAMVHKRPCDGPQKPRRVGDLWDPHPGGTGTTWVLTG